MLQVEVARLQYLLPRLVGLHDALSRQGGTSGSMSSRGSGEKKLELDRRRAQSRLTELRRELAEMETERRTQQKKRARSAIPRVALVGYTNAGKSTIMNSMVMRYLGDVEKRSWKRICCLQHWIQQSAVLHRRKTKRCSCPIRSVLLTSCHMVLSRHSGLHCRRRQVQICFCMWWIFGS